MLTGELFKLADRQAHWLNVRQRTIAENIAHANTPGFVTKTVSGFEAGLRETPVPFAVTHSNHINPRGAGDANEVAYKVADAPDGSPVRLENEMMSSMEVRRAHELNTSIVKAFNRMILATAKG